MQSRGWCFSSWWYALCLRCRQKEEHPSWQPTLWPRVCPYPFCPTYRQFSRIIALCLIVIFSWGVLYALIGETAAPPSGKVYTLMFLTICSYFGGWLVSLTTLPPLIGMLFTGLLFQNVGIVNLDSSYSHFSSELR